MVNGMAHHPNDVFPVLDRNYGCLCSRIPRYRYSGSSWLCGTALLAFDHPCQRNYRRNSIYDFSGLWGKISEGVVNITWNSILMGLAIAGSLTLISRLSPALIIRLAGMPEQIQLIAEDFLKVFSLVLIPTYLMIITGGILRSSGRVRLAMVNSACAACLNIVADLVLSFGWGPIPGMGYIGIAWATACATTVGMFLNITQIFIGSFKTTSRSSLKPRPRCLKNLIKLGVPSALQQTAWNAGTIVIYFLVGSLEGAEITALAAMTGGVRVEAIIFLPVFALNMASAVLTGNKLGAGDIVGARKGAKITAALCLVLVLIPAIAIFISAPIISALLTSDKSVLAEMVNYLRINMLGTPFLAIGISLGGALQGAGDTLATMRIVFIGMWVIRIPIILFMIHVMHAGPIGVWWAMTISIVILCGLMIKRFGGNAWIKASVDRGDKTMLWEACLETKTGAKKIDSE